MIGMINSIVTKVVDTVSGPLYAWGPKPMKKRPGKPVKAAAKPKKRCTGCKKKSRCN
jgi:hypothetical protein